MFGPLVFRKVILAITGGWVMEGQGNINNIFHCHCHICYLKILSSSQI